MNLELAYIAAFLDCDGTIVIMGSKRKTKGCGERVEHYPKAMFYSQNLSVLHEIQAVIGGKVTPPNNGPDVYVLQLAPVATVECLRKLMPFLRIKREQGLLALELHKLVKSKKFGRWNPITPEQLALRESMRIRMQELNHKDAVSFRSHRSNWVNSVKPSSEEAIPSRAAGGTVPAEGVTAREVSPNDNPLQERPALSIVPRREEIA